MRVIISIVKILMLNYIPERSINVPNVTHI